MSKHLPLTALLLASMLVLAGCTDDKANALYTAAKLFQKQSEAALDAYEMLIVQGALGPDISADDRAKRFLETQIVEYKKKTNPVEQQNWRPNVDSLREALSDEQFQQNVEGTVSSQFHTTRQIYAELIEAFALLPDVQFLGVKPVKCSEQLVAQLTKQLTENAKYLSEHPINFINRSERANSLLAKEIRNPRANESDRKMALNELVGVIDEETLLNRDAIAKSVAATDAGLKLLALVQNYDQVTLKEILAYADKLAPIADFAEGAGATTKLRNKIDEINTKFESDDRLKRLAKRGLNTERIQCR